VSVSIRTPEVRRADEEDSGGWKLSLDSLGQLEASIHETYELGPQQQEELLGLVSELKAAMANVSTTPEAHAPSRTREAAAGTSTHPIASHRSHHWCTIISPSVPHKQYEPEHWVCQRTHGCETDVASRLNHDEDPGRHDGG
jgi:hypothetical protein